MDEHDDILTTGTLFWIKAAHRGTVAVPLEFLTDEQKQILRTGLKEGRYPDYFNYQSQNAHFKWEEKHCSYELLVTDIDLSPEVKRKLSPRKKPPQDVTYRVTLSDIKRLKEEYEAGHFDEDYVRDILTNLTWRPWQYTEWNDLREKKIQNACEICGETTSLILQHTIQPRKTKDIIFELVGEQYEELLSYYREQLHESELPIPANAEKVPVCPCICPKYQESI